MIPPSLPSIDNADRCLNDEDDDGDSPPMLLLLFIMAGTISAPVVVASANAEAAIRWAAFVIMMVCYYVRLYSRFRFRSINVLC